jgi:hypothetical protein
MKHRASQNVFAHWEARRRDRLLPERCEIDPSDIRSALGDTFILSYDRSAGHPFRLAGTRVCALFGRELRGSAFMELWGGRAADPVARLLVAAADDSVGVVAGVRGVNGNGSPVELELLLLPLKHGGRTHQRVIGTLAPFAPPYWLGLDRIVALTLGEHRFLGHSGHSPPLLPFPGVDLGPSSVSHARPQKPRLVVYEGGQS